MNLLNAASVTAFAAALAACGQQSSSVSTAASSGGGNVAVSSSSSAGNEVALSGSNGHAELAGNKIEIKEGIVLVNEVSYGPVQQGAIVNYVLTADGPRLFVGGKIRSVAK